MLNSKLKLNKEDPFHDFRNFLYYIFKDVLLFGEPHPVQYDIADWMQNCPVSIRRAQAQAMRGCGKTVIACAYVCWLWYINPSIRVMTISSVAQKAAEFAGLVKQILDTAELLQHLRPDPDAEVTLHHGKRKASLKKSKNTETAFDVSGAGPGKDPSFAAYGVFGGYTGSHPDVIIPDDVEIPENSLTVTKRHRLYEKLRELESLVMEGGMVFPMGTPQTEESIYMKLAEAGYPVRRWPAELPDLRDEKETENVAPLLIQMAEDGHPGDPSYPERFPIERLNEKKAKGMAYYNLQMLLNTRLADQERYPLKLRNLMVFDTPVDMAPAAIGWGTAERLPYETPGFTGDYLYAPAFVDQPYDPFQAKVLYIDPKGAGGDSVGYCVVGVKDGILYVLDAGGYAVGRGQSGTSEAVMVKLAKIAAMYEIKKVIVESNWGGSKNESAYAKLLQPHLARWAGGCGVETQWNTGQKEARILDCLEPMVNNHRICISHQVAQKKELLYQFTHITRERGALVHDDEIEALWGACSQFISHVALDPDAKEAERHENACIRSAKAFEASFKKQQKAGRDPWHPRKTQQRRQRWKRC
jgi:hypothetical protein